MLALPRQPLINPTVEAVASGEAVENPPESAEAGVVRSGLVLVWAEVWLLGLAWAWAVELDLEWE